MQEKKKSRRKHQPKGLNILHEDRDILVVDKAPGVLTMGTDREKVKTAYYRLMDYARKGNPKSRERIFIVHRLDREVSGILVFARSVAAKSRISGTLGSGVRSAPTGGFLLDNSTNSIRWCSIANNNRSSFSGLTSSSGR